MRSYSCEVSSGGCRRIKPGLRASAIVRETARRRWSTQAFTMYTGVHKTHDHHVLPGSFNPHLSASCRTGCSFDELSGSREPATFCRSRPLGQGSAPHHHESSAEDRKTRPLADRTVDFTRSSPSVSDHLGVDAKFSAQWFGVSQGQPARRSREQIGLHLRDRGGSQASSRVARPRPYFARPYGR